MTFLILTLLRTPSKRVAEAGNVVVYDCVTCDSDSGDDDKYEHCLILLPTAV